jgi:alpha-L-fucosidase
MKRFLILFLMFFSGFSFAVSLDYSNKDNTTKWLSSTRFGILFDWSARVNFETELYDSYDNMLAKGLQKGSLYSMIKDKNGDLTGIRNWEMWNPEQFDPKSWLNAVKLSGAKYFVFTLNDRYGFLNFDSPATSLDSASTIWGVDIASALAMEAQKEKIPYLWDFQQYGGIDFILGPWLYFKSRWNQGIENYAQYRKQTIYHIITNTDRYGKCLGIYFKGNQGGIVPSEHPAREGEDPEFVDQENSTYLKGLLDAQPWLVISSEFYLKKDPNYHPSINLDRFKFKNYNSKPNRPDGSHSVTFSLESDLEGWANVTEQETRTPLEVIHLLALSAGHNENLLLRVTPNNKGSIPKRQINVLEKVGEWLKKYESSIVNTVNGPYTPGAWGVSTRRANKIYLHILQHSPDGIYTLEELPEGIVGVKLLNTNQLLKYSNKDGNFTINIPPAISSSRSEADMIVEITYPKDIDTTQFNSFYREKWKESIASDATITASQTSKLRNRDDDVNVLLQNFIDSAGKGSNKLYPRVFWSAPELNEEPSTNYPVTLEVDFGSTKKIKAISILEKNSRIKDWKVEYFDSNGKWQKIYEASDEHLAFFDWKLPQALDATKVRLVILQTYGKAPQLRYFRVFGE